jgi:hypothetical protein
MTTNFWILCDDYDVVGVGLFYRRHLTVLRPLRVSKSFTIISFLLSHVFYLFIPSSKKKTE